MRLQPIQPRLVIQRRIHVPRRYRVDPDAMLRPFRRQGLAEMDDGGFGGIVGALFLRVQDAGAGDGADEDYGAAAAAGDHVAGAGLGDEEGAGEVCVDESAENLWVVVLGFDVGVDDAGAVD